MGELFRRCVPTLVFVGIMAASGGALADGGFGGGMIAELESLYPDLKPISGSDCTYCHGPSFSPFFNDLGSAISSDAAIHPACDVSEAACRSALRNRLQAMEADVSTRFVPILNGPVTRRIPLTAAVAGTTIRSLAYSRGNRLQGGADPGNVAFSFFVAGNVTSKPTTQGALTIDGSGNIAVSAGALAEGQKQEASIAPLNTTGFRFFSTGASAISQLTVQVNRLPTGVAGIVEPNPPTEGDGATFTSTNLLAGVSDADGDPLQTPSASLVLHDFVDETGTSVLPAPSDLNPTLNAGRISFNTTVFEGLNTGETRTLIFSYDVSDGFDAVGGSYRVTFSGVDEPIVVNQPPVVSPLTPGAISEDAAVPIAFDLLADNSGVPFVDPENDTLSVRPGSLVQTAGRDPGVRINETAGELRFTTLDAFQSLPQGASEVLSFTYDVNDGSNSVQNTLTVTVTGVNDAPVATEVRAAREEGTLRTTVDLLPSTITDADTENVDLIARNLTIVSAADLADPGSVTIENDDLLSLQPLIVRDLAVGETVDLVFAYEIFDGFVAVPNTVRVTVNGVAATDHQLNVGLYANNLSDRYQTERFGRHFEPATTVPGACLSCHQLATVNAAKPVCENPGDFTVFGTRLCQTRRGEDIALRLQDVAPNFEPQINEASPVREVLAEPNALVGRPLDHNAGRDVANNPSTIVAFDIVAASSPGQFSVDASGQIRTTASVPPPGFYTIDVVPINDAGQRDSAARLRVGVPGFFPVDGLGKPKATRVTIEVVDFAPLARDDGPVNTDTASPVTIDVLANDEGGQADIVTIASNGAKGTAVVNATTNTITYTPNGIGTGADTFVYRSENEIGDSQATVTVNIVPSGAPLAVDDRVNAASEQVIAIPILANDRGGEPDTVTISVSPAAGSAFVNAAREIEFTAPPGFEGRITMAYLSANSFGQTAATVTVNVAVVDGGAFEDMTDDPSLKPVALALGQSCDILIGSATPVRGDQKDLVDVCTAISAESGAGGNVDGAFIAIRNEEMLAVGEIARTVGRSMKSTIFDRINSSWGGAGRGVNVGDVRVNFGDQTVSSEYLDSVVQHLAQGDGAGFFSNPDLSAFGLFLSGEITLADRSTTSRQSGYDLQSVSVQGGVDYAFTENMMAGAAFGYSQSVMDFAGQNGGIDAQSYQVSLYGSVNDLFTEGLRFGGVLTAGLSSYNSDRRIQFTANGTTFDRMAVADFLGQHVNAVARLEYDLAPLAVQNPFPSPEGWKYTAFAELDYLNARTDGYDERGAGGLSLSVARQKYESLIAEFGLRTETPPMETLLGPISVFGEGSLNYELLDARNTTSASFAALGSGGPRFIVVGDDIDQVFGRLRFGASGEVMGADLTVAYETTFGRRFFSQQSLSASLGGPFVGGDWLGLNLTTALISDQKAPELQTELRYEIKF